MAEPALELRNISKSFPGVQALRDANLSIEAGEVHALLGGNGAGKSTMVSIVAGNLQPDTGEIWVGGRRVSFDAPRDALARGVAVIYQELVQVPGLSVAENVLLGRLPRTTWGTVDWRAVHRRAGEALAALGLELDTTTPLGSLPTGLQQQVEIARAITSDPRLLVLDEPTSALTEREVDNLFALLRRLKEQGRTIIYISHHLDEIFELTDRLTVLRDGRNVLTTRSAEIAPRALAEAMVGRSLDIVRKRQRPVRRNEERLVVDRLTTDSVTGISLAVKAGEIVGLAGMLGSGRTELLRAIAGADRALSGGVMVDGSPLHLRSPADAIAAGIVLVPEDRKSEGLILDMPVASNVTLPFLDRFSRAGFVSGGGESDFVNTMIRRFGIKTPGLQQAVRKLSGGNQQKTILARWVSIDPKVLLLDQPLRGLDVLAKEEVYDKIDELASAGAAVLVAATEAIELLNFCHRVVVLSGGRLVERIDDLDGLDEADLTHRAMRGDAPVQPGGVAV